MLNNKTIIIILLNLAENRLILANLAYSHAAKYQAIFRVISQDNIIVKYIINR